MTTWPRSLNLKDAARYAGFSPRYFKGLVRAGRMPGPWYNEGRTQRWDRRAIDAAIDGTPGGTHGRVSTPADWRACIDDYRKGGGNA